MANKHTMSIYYALRKTDPIVAKAYLDHSHVREKINSELVHTGYAPKVYEEVTDETKG